MEKSIARIRQFHQAFEIPTPDCPELPGLTQAAREELRLAAGLVRQASKALHDACAAQQGSPVLMRGHLESEELAEFLEAMASGNLAQVLHESADQLVVKLGSMDALGLACVFEQAFDQVMDANMSKLGEDGKPIKNEAGRVVKGPNFHKADLEDLVSEAFAKAIVESF